MALAADARAVQGKDVVVVGTAFSAGVTIILDSARHRGDILLKIKQPFGNCFGAAPV